MHIRHGTGICVHAVDHGTLFSSTSFALGILATLQIRVHEEVVGVGLVHEAIFVVGFGGFGCLNGCELGVDILLPHAEAREDVSRHVGGMGTGRSDFSVVLGRRQAIFGHGRVVAGVNDVVHYTRIVGITGEERRKNGHRLVLVRRLVSFGASEASRDSA